MHCRGRKGIFRCLWICERVLCGNVTYGDTDSVMYVEDKRAGHSIFALQRQLHRARIHGEE